MKLCAALFSILVLLFNHLQAAPYPAVAYDNDGYFHLESGQGSYVGYKPDTYDPATPISLFVWAHGCGGRAQGDLSAIAPEATRSTQSYIAISLGGRDGGCWDLVADQAKVLAAIADVSRYFNINPQKIYLGGYSSGGDLVYRTAFYHANHIAGLLVENTSPFYITGSTAAASLAAATRTFHVAHLAHLQDAAYPIATVRSETAALSAAGFRLVRIEKPGNHHDIDTATTGTRHDLTTYLLPYLDAGWVAAPPAAGPPYEIDVRSRPATFGAVLGNKVVAEGQKATVAAKPQAGHRFLFWTEGKKIVSRYKIYRFTATAARTLTAHFQ